MRRTLTALLILLLLVPAWSPRAAAIAPFADALTSQHGAAALLLRGLGILTGYSDGTFQPDASMTRAEFASMLAQLLRATGAATTGTAAKFVDITVTNRWAAADISLVARSGLMCGDPGGTFRPADKVSGGEVAAVVIRLLGREATALASARPWPANYIDTAEALNVWSPAYPGTYAASRGMIASCLAKAIDVPLAGAATGSGVASSGATLLAEMGLQRVDVTVLSVASGPAGETLLTVPDGTIAGTDGRKDNLIVTRDTSVWGVVTAADLAGRRIEAYIRGDGAAVAVERLFAGKVSDVSRTAGGIAVWLADGFSTLLPIRMPISLNHRSASASSISIGSCVRFTTDATGQQVLAAEAFAPVSGAIATQSPQSYLVGSDPEAVVPVNAATAYELNGQPVAKDAFDKALAGAGTASATVTWADDGGCAARLALSAAAADHTDRIVAGSDVRLIRGTSLRCLTVCGDDTVYSIARTATVLRDGVADDPVPQRGDRVFFTTDATTGDIDYLVITTDRTAPALAASTANGASEYRLVFDELIDPGTISVSVDGTAFGTAGSTLSVYDLTQSASGESTITLRPQRPFTNRQHTVTWRVTDYAGNQAAGTTAFTTDSAAMRFASAEWPSGLATAGSPYQVNVYFFGDADALIDDASAKNLSNWTFTDGNPANGVTHLTAVTHVGYYVTLLFDGPIDPGSRLRGSIRDNAGNVVSVDCVSPR